MAAHPFAVLVAEDRPDGAVAGRAANRTSDSGWEGDESGLVALAVHPEHAMASGLTEGSDVDAGGLEIRTGRGRRRRRL
jgi:hypothetical protein